MIRVIVSIKFWVSFVASTGVLVGTFVYFSWVKPTVLQKPSILVVAENPSLSTIEANMQKTEVPKPLSTLSETPQSEPEEKTQSAATTTNTFEQNDIAFVLHINNSQEEFDDWQEAKEKLNSLTDESHAKLTIKFSKAILTPHLNEQEFRAWLSRLGDYIFARRMLLTEKKYKNLPEGMKSVVRQAPLMRTSKKSVHKRGSALFVPKEHIWEVIIRGLENQPKELLMVAEDILLPALKNPETIARCEPIKLWKNISTVLIASKFNLTQNQEEIADEFLKYYTLSTSMKKDYKIVNNLRAFLPLLKLDKVSWIDDNKKDLIEEINTKFFKAFYEKIICSIQDNDEIDETIDNLWKQQSNWLHQQLLDWVKESDVSTLLRRSLFTEIN